MSFALIPKQFESFPVNLSWIKYFHYIVHYWWDFTVGVGSKNDNIINAENQKFQHEPGLLNTSSYFMFMGSCIAIIRQ